MKKTLENTKEAIKEELKKLNKKGDLTPAEMDTVFKAVDTIKDICEMCGEDLDGHVYSMGYSEYGYGNTYSHGASRSPVTGRYISHSMPMNHYSGHSITDRMVACLEPMYDQAQSEHERQKINEAIMTIRNMQ